MKLHDKSVLHVWVQGYDSKSFKMIFTGKEKSEDPNFSLKKIQSLHMSQEKKVQREQKYIYLY